MYCHIYFLLPLAFFSFLFLCFFSFSFSVLLLYFSSSSSSSSFFFLYSSINFFLPPLTSLPLKNLLLPKHLASRREPIQLRKLLTEGLICGRRGSLLQNSVISFSSLFFLYVKKGRSLKALVFYVKWVYNEVKIRSKLILMVKDFFEFLY